METRERSEKQRSSKLALTCCVVKTHIKGCLRAFRASAGNGTRKSLPEERNKPPSTSSCATLTGRCRLITRKSGSSGDPEISSHGIFRGRGGFAKRKKLREASPMERRRREGEGEQAGGREGREQGRESITGQGRTALARINNIRAR